MANYTNPDDVILKPKPPAPNPLYEPCIDPTVLREVLKEPPKGVSKIKSWWDSLRIKPYISFHRNETCSKHKSVVVGIQGTF